MLLQRRLQTAQTAKQTIRNKAKPSSFRGWFQKMSASFLGFLPTCFWSNKRLRRQIPNYLPTKFPGSAGGQSVALNVRHWHKADIWIFTVKRGAHRSAGSAAPYAQRPPGYIPMQAC